MYTNETDLVSINFLDSSTNNHQLAGTNDCSSAKRAATQTSILSMSQKIDLSKCTDVGPDCPVSATAYGDFFTTGACIFFVVSYSILTIGQLVLGWMSKTWSFTAYLVAGSLFELVGYIGRTLMSHNPFLKTANTIQIVLLILAPTLIAATISLTFKHLVLYYGPQYSWLRPTLYPWVFVGSDFVSIVIQGIGGATAASGIIGNNPDPKKIDLGNNLLLAGVSFQIANMVVCGGLMLIYIYRYRKDKTAKDRIGSSHAVTPLDSTDNAESSPRTAHQDIQAKRFIYAITVAYIAIIVRCIYRIPEMAAGWGSDIMKNETTFLVFDGGMILIATLLLTGIHPQFFFPFLGRKPSGFNQKTGLLEAETVEMARRAE